MNGKNMSLVGRRAREAKRLGTSNGGERQVMLMHREPPSRCGASSQSKRGREFGVFASCVAAIAVSTMLAACRTGAGAGAEAPPSMIAPVSITAADLPGSWGLASYRNEADRARTEQEAKVACGNPYNITQGPSGGVMMHLADQSEASELILKTDSSGRTFIGPPGPPGVAQDRLIVSYENNVLIAEWLDQSARERYGTMLFVRCGSA